MLITIFKIISFLKANLKDDLEYIYVSKSVILTFRVIENYVCKSINKEERLNKLLSHGP